MLKVLLSALVLSLSQLSAAIPLKKESKINFSWNKEFLTGSQQGVQYFYELLDKSQSAGRSEALNILLPLDVDREWQKRSEEYHIASVRLAYVVNKDISFFSKDTLFNVGYMNAIAPGYQVRKTGDTFSIAGSPTADFSLRYRSSAELNTISAKSYLSYIANLDRQNLSTGEITNKIPDVILEQHIYNFGKFLVFRTSPMSRVVSRHYSLGKGKTLIVVDTLNYLYNVPPGNSYFNNLVSTTQTLIGNLRKY